MARKYELKKRAKKQEETRQKIVEALVDLHQEVGPANTTIKGVAERAGVQRLTVYRHFPDDQSMFEACSAHFISQNPPPDPTPWMQIEDPEARLGTAISDLYSYFAQTEQITANVLRDARDIPELAAVTEPIMRAMNQYADIISERWDIPEQRQRLFQAALIHAISFSTWQSLARGQGLEHTDAVRLMVQFVCCTASLEEYGTDDE